MAGLAGPHHDAQLPLGNRAIGKLGYWLVVHVEREMRPHRFDSQSIPVVGPDSAGGRPIDDRPGRVADPTPERHPMGSRCQEQVHVAEIAGTNGQAEIHVGGRATDQTHIHRGVEVSEQTESGLAPAEQ